MRLTSRWTETAAEAFGESGAKGEAGERWLAEVLRARGCHVATFGCDYQMQVAGIDMIVDDRIQIDVKNNLKQNQFYVEATRTGWLFNPKKTSDTICHVNPKTGQTVCYERAKMQKHLARYRGDLCRFDVTNLPEFCVYEVL